MGQNTSKLWTAEECALAVQLIRSSETVREAHERFEAKARNCTFRRFHMKTRQILGSTPNEVLSLDLLEACEDYATNEQKQIIKRACKEGLTTVAKSLGITNQTLRYRLKSVLVAAARAGYSPNRDALHRAPPGMSTKGLTIQRDAGGNIIQTWAKNYLDKESKFQALAKATQQLLEPLKGLAKPVKMPGLVEKDLLAVYPMGDPHIGLMTWAPETTDNHDLERGEKLLYNSIDQLCKATPAAEQALIVNLGDYFHADDSFNRTPTGHNPLDVDSRYAKILDVGVNVFRRLIQRALQRHKKVRVICEIGNHDMHMAIMLAKVLKAYYEKEPRVTIDDSPAPYHWYEFGSNFFGVTHGNNTKPTDLPGIMAALKPEQWGSSKFRFWLIGHVHQQQIWDKPGCLIESFRTLAPPDAWHFKKGYITGRSADSILHHRTRGRIQRYTVGLGSL